jgi:DNA-binding beta-propeller fold protein YncE
MKSIHRLLFVITVLSLWYLTAFLYLSTSFGQEPPRIRHSIKYLFSIDAAVSGSSFRSIDDIFIDSKNREIYVIDSGNRRVVITDIDGGFLYQFPYIYADIKGYVKGISVVEDGTIYVAEERRVLILQYNGKYKRDMDLSSIPGHDTMIIQSMAIDEDTVYIGDGANDRVVTVDRKEEVFLTELKEDMGTNIKLYLDNGGFYIMDPSTATVSRFTREGKLLNRFGKLSGLTGGFSMIADIAVDRKKGRLVVVDFNRLAALFFDRSGEFLFEFGGAQTFRGPRSAAVDEMGRIYIGDGVRKIRVFEVLEEKLESDENPEPGSGPEKG